MPEHKELAPIIRKAIEDWGWVEDRYIGPGFSDARATFIARRIIEASSIRVYKVRHRETGLFSPGGSNPRRFTRIGKVWQNIGHIKNHLTNWLATSDYIRLDFARVAQKRTLPADWEIVEFAGFEVSARPASDVMSNDNGS